MNSITNTQSVNERIGTTNINNNDEVFTAHLFTHNIYKIAEAYAIARSALRRLKRFHILNTTEVDNNNLEFEYTILDLAANCASNALIEEFQKLRSHQREQTQFLVIFKFLLMKCSTIIEANSQDEAEMIFAQCCYSLLTFGPNSDSNYHLNLDEEHFLYEIPEDIGDSDDPVVEPEITVYQLI